MADFTLKFAVAKLIAYCCDWPTNVNENCDAYILEPFFRRCHSGARGA